MDTTHCFVLLAVCLLVFPPGYDLYPGQNSFTKDKEKCRERCDRKHGLWKAGPPANCFRSVAYASIKLRYKCTCWMDPFLKTTLKADDKDRGGSWARLLAISIFTGRSGWVRKLMKKKITFKSVAKWEEEQEQEQQRNAQTQSESGRKR
ncbi:unnamed protein product [Bemisia tabaci]|uniref:Secreted protein n=1 Tax=Bemisia tabaci TaxID=7038 RepID=A0A9N9ZYZ2_BEMTA|nr:unnamed protein product [Bemisia tabaci]